jgi:hypothetical protein
VTRLLDGHLVGAPPCYPAKVRRSGGRVRNREGEGSMRRHAWQESRSHSGGVVSGGMVTRTCCATGETLPAPVRNHRERGRRYNRASTREMYCFSLNSYQGFSLKRFQLPEGSKPSLQLQQSEGGGDDLNGTVASNYTCRTRRLDSGLDASGVGKSIATELLYSRREIDIPSSARTTAALQLSVYEPIVDRTCSNAKTAGDLTHGQFTGCTHW